MDKLNTAYATVSRAQAIADSSVAQAIENFSLPYLTEPPTEPNTDGLKFVILANNPAQKYDGYMYIITGA